MNDAKGRTQLRPEEAPARGMTIAVTAREAPERMAVISAAGSLSYGELNARANQLVRALARGGVGPGDALALLCSNRHEFAVVYAATLRGGYRLTCINWHLQRDEVAYIVENCEARAFLADARFAPVAAEVAREAPKVELRLAIGGLIDGFADFDRALAAEPAHDVEEPRLGSTMLYTSGTTGRPKGVYRRQTPPAGGLAREIGKIAKYRPDSDRMLCTGPLYHAAPLAFNLAAPLAAGIGTVLMERWDALEALRAIERHRVTHTHMVATMFHRLLALPAEERARHDLSSLRVMLHGAAPTPVHVKKALIDWLGPIVYEYYAATEGGGTFVTSDEWLARTSSPNSSLGTPTAAASATAGCIRRTASISAG